MMRTNAHSFGSEMTQELSHRSQAICQCSMLRMSKCQLRSMITRMLSMKKTLHNRPTIMILVSISKGFN